MNLHWKRTVALACVAAASMAACERHDEAHADPASRASSALGDVWDRLSPYGEAQVARRLATAVASRDPGQITRAFHDAVYSTMARMSQSLPAIRPHLKDPNPYVRYTAAQYLYVAGDSSGTAALLDMVQAPRPVLATYDVPPEVVEATGSHQQDIRVMAAALLGRYRRAESRDALLGLYERTADGRFEVARALLRIGVFPDSMATRPFAASSLSITFYGLGGARQFVPALQELLEIPPAARLRNDSALTVAAAWALATLTGEQRYVEHLASAAKQALEPNENGRLNYLAVTTALRALGSLPHPRAREVLEEALDSSDFSAVETASVNLLLNQKGGSEKARQLLIRQLRGERPRRLQATVLYDLATSLDDPEITAAGEAHDRGQRGEWYLAAVERRNWPIYNWIDDYVVRLNELPPYLRPERVFRGPLE